jgi:uncharacterized SAM-binding protein YcdF (DUF218 family)
VALLVVALIQLLYFSSVIVAGTMPCTIRADAILVYDGDPARIPAAMLEAREIQCPRVVISSNQIGLIRRLRKQGPVAYRGSVTIVPGASTTVENARFSVPVVKGVLVGSPGKRVLLMTSWYHLPRAYFLTRLYSFGSGITWDYVSTEPVPVGWWKRQDFRAEFPKFWGSLVRVGLAAVGITGLVRPMTDALAFRRTPKRLPRPAGVTRPAGRGRGGPRGSSGPCGTFAPRRG